MIRKWNKRLKLAQTVIKPREWTLLARRIWNMSGSPCVMSSSVYSSSLMQLKSFSRPWISGRRCCTKHVRRDSSHVCRVHGTPVYGINESMNVCDTAESICPSTCTKYKAYPIHQAVNINLRTCVAFCNYIKSLRSVWFFHVFERTQYKKIP